MALRCSLMEQPSCRHALSAVQLICLCLRNAALDADSRLCKQHLTLAVTTNSSHVAAAAHWLLKRGNSLVTQVECCCCVAPVLRFRHLEVWAESDCLLYRWALQLLCSV
jgi:hypothetical protein